MKRDRLVLLILVFAVVSCGIGIINAAIPNNTLRNNWLVITGVNVTGSYQMDGVDIVDATRAASFITLDTGQGANELYDMDQNVLTTSAPTFATVNTGQGDNELYGMDQSVQTTDSPEFVNITLSGTLTTNTINEYSTGDGINIDGGIIRDGAFLPEGQVYGVQWNQPTDTWTQIDYSGNTITPTTADFNNHTVWGSINRVNLSPSGVVNARWGDGDYASNGSNGEVMVEIPAFYVKGEQKTPNVYQWWISGVSMTGFEIHPAFLQRDGRIKPYIYIGAYEASLLVGTGAHDTVTTLKLTSVAGEQPWTGGEIDALPYDTGSVVFARGETITGAIGGGTGVVIDWYVATGAWATSDAAGKVYIKQQAVANFQAEALAGSVSGVANATGVQVAEALTIGGARTYANNQGAGWGIMNIWSLSAVKLLFIVEYGNMDSQVEVGRGIVDKAAGAGFAGEETAFAGIDGNLDAAGTGAGTGTDGEVPVSYRYMENLWGNVYVFIDGYNAVDAAYRITPRDGDGAFADALVTYESSSMVPITSDGYISNIEWDRVMKYMFIGKATAGGAATYIPDYQYSHDATETNILLAGGSWDVASAAGLGRLNSGNVAADSVRHFGARAEYAP